MILFRCIWSCRVTSLYLKLLFKISHCNADIGCSIDWMFGNSIDWVVCVVLVDLVV